MSSQRGISDLLARAEAQGWGKETPEQIAQFQQWLLKGAITDDGNPVETEDYAQPTSPVHKGDAKQAVSNKLTPNNNVKLLLSISNIEELMDYLRSNNFGNFVENYLIAMLKDEDYFDDRIYTPVDRIQFCRLIHIYCQDPLPHIDFMIKQYLDLEPYAFLLRNSSDDWADLTADESVLSELLRLFEDREHLYALLPSPKDLRAFFDALDKNLNADDAAWYKIRLLQVILDSFQYFDIGPLGADYVTHFKEYFPKAYADLVEEFFNYHCVYSENCLLQANELRYQYKDAEAQKLIEKWQAEGKPLEVKANALFRKLAKDPEMSHAAEPEHRVVRWW